MDGVWRSGIDKTMILRHEPSAKEIWNECTRIDRIMGDPSFQICPARVANLGGDCGEKENGKTWGTARSNGIGSF